ncbi:ATP-binding cassette domain-containing protein [Ciceribacter sp. L1K23]|uniref:ATP-binding cassette domain-containing protein n=1 Tax=Ciceribacter sp. L1K23 TaxID=2820276 RepID=UPI001B82DFF3|nr:ATP-binding cassette domain-containing protein [Ciceribacter sp. L1K23]MBR0554061.1 ATP-binding cassette domain-containing protein [Ciceribacter sp. L1K23]
MTRDLAIAPDERAPVPAFSVEGVNYSVAGRQLLHAIDMMFPTGEITALIGHNGSGKSTLLKLLARQIHPESGAIRYAGQDLNELQGRAFSRKVAYLSQDVASAPGMTVRELVACGRYPWHGALGRFTDNDRQKVDEAIGLTHLEGLANRAVETLSGGERQRAWIAMMMAQDSECLLLDEPTSALDIAHQLEVLSLVRRLSRERGLSVVVVLHDINMAARFCDRIHALKDGRFIASGRPADLMNSDKLRQIYAVQMDVTQHPVLEIPLAYVS